MLNELMGEIKTDNQKKIQVNNNVGVKVPAGKQTNKAKQEEDDIAKMLADLGWSWLEY